MKGRLVCAEAVNAPGEFMASKQFIRDGIEFDPVLLADTTIELAGAATTLPQTDTWPPAEPTMEEATPKQEMSVPAGIPGYARITFVTSEIASTTIDAQVGDTLMQSALAANVPNILAECGGLATCGTCHLYIQKPWSDFLPEPEYEEETLLEFIEGYRPNSRLGCQVVVEEVLDGMVAHTVARY